jgi:FixJ family two-component response regulator
MRGPRNIYIAVIDDDESMCRSFGRLLRVSGFQAISYPSAEAFLADLKHPQFDCLVLDVQLGGMSGIELKTRLIFAGSTTPVIFITSHDDPEARRQALTAGCAGYFRKTDCGRDVLDAIRRAVAGDHTTSANPSTKPEQKGP